MVVKNGGLWSMYRVTSPDLGCEVIGGHPFMELLPRHWLCSDGWPPLHRVTPPDLGCIVMGSVPYIELLPLTFICENGPFYIMSSCVVNGL